MPFRLFSGAAFICPEFLYSLKHIAVNNGGLCVGEDTIILQGVLQTLFQFVGLGVGFEVHRTAGAFPLTGVTLQVSESPADIATAVSAGDFFLSYAPLGVD